MLIAASAVQFAGLGGHEASNEEEFYFRSPSQDDRIDNWLAHAIGMRC